MKTSNFIKTIFITLIVSLIVRCKLQEVPFTSVSVVITLPDDAISGGKDNYIIKLTNIASGRIQIDTTDTTGLVQMLVEEGVYNVEVTGERKLNIVVDNITKSELYSICGLHEKSLVIGEQVELTIPLQMGKKGNSFVFKEIYYPGSTTPANNHYYQDQFFEIFNNSDSVLYADGLSVLESDHISSVSVNEYSINYPNDLIVGAIYTIPGNGTTYPVQPGKSIVVASLGINHKTANANSPVDLSKADFEWYDAGKDVDVPEVTNMIRNFCYSNTIWVLHVVGSHAYALFKAPGNYSDFISNNFVSVQTPSGAPKTRVKVSNSLILDAVELGVAGNIGSKSLSSVLDLSYTYCQGSYCGKSVRRKVLKWENGRAYLLDTDNSANDFIPNATPKPWEVE